MIVGEDSATIDGVARQGLESDHFHLHKFSSAEDPKYGRVLSQLKPMIEDAPARIQARLNRKIGFMPRRASADSG